MVSILRVPWVLGLCTRPSVVTESRCAKGHHRHGRYRQSVGNLLPKKKTGRARSPVTSPSRSRNWLRPPQAPIYRGGVLSLFHSGFCCTSVMHPDEHKNTFTHEEAGDPSVRI